jgi:hypothetical protein
VTLFSHSGATAPFRDFRAPRDSGSVLVDPKLTDAPLLVANNRRLNWTQSPTWLALRQQARQQMLADAIEYTSAYRSVAWVDELGKHSSPRDGVILMAGHQPELFHPGVWFKNFALHRIAANHRWLPVNLVVDNDVARQRSIRVPGESSSGHVTSEWVAYDQGPGGIPYEQLRVEHLATFNDFDRRVIERIKTLVVHPCVTSLWEHARDAVKRCGIAGCALAQARHSLEETLGLRTVEIPISAIARSIPFSKFVLMILQDLGRFQQCYNDSTWAYRRAHGIRGTAHPVPNLTRQDQWLEAPLWIYSDDSPRRRAAWVKFDSASNTIVIRDPLSADDNSRGYARIVINDIDSGAEQLSSMQSSSWKLRPRALLTTMYARLVLSDLFLHGIGGGKYDQLGDRISAQFFGIEPPQFMVVSATIRLPNAELTIEAEAKIRDLKKRIRDTYFQPERFAGVDELDETLVNQKLDLLREIPPRGHKRAWHSAVQKLNQRMSTALGRVRSEWLESVHQTEIRLQSQSILASREHPFCLYPANYLTDTFDRMLTAIPES